MLKCYLPFVQATVVESGSVYPCLCPSWLKADAVVGNTHEQRLPEIWNGPAYQRIRQLFLDGRYGEMCREEVCPYLLGEEVAAPPDEQVLAAVNARQTVLDYGIKTLQHDVDRGCNLNCTMCRDEKISPDAGNVARALRDVDDALALGSVDTLIWSGAGEVIAMGPLVRELESDRFSSRGIEISLVTNLTGFNRKLWDRIGHNAIRLIVSADGCSPEVYEPIRVGARWPAVLENLRMAGMLRRTGQLKHLLWNYTVLKQNICDVGKAIDLAEEIGVDQIRINAQLGSLSRTNGNMFEDYDLDALDALYDQLEQSGAFDKPFVLVSTTGMRNRRYRTLAYRLEMAEHIYNRRTQALGDPRQRIWLHTSALRVLQRTIADVDAGSVGLADPLPEASRTFLRRLVDPSTTEWVTHWHGAFAEGLLRTDWPSLQATIAGEQAIIRQAGRLLESLDNN